MMRNIPPLTTLVVGVVEAGVVLVGAVGMVVSGVVAVGVVTGLVVTGEFLQPVITKAMTNNTIMGINIFFTLSFSSC